MQEIQVKNSNCEFMVFVRMDVRSRNGQHRSKFLRKMTGLVIEVVAAKIDLFINIKGEDRCRHILVTSMLYFDGLLYP